MSKDHHHLTKEQRCQLYLLNKRGDSKKNIAKELGVHRSSIYRELKRNTVGGEYCYKQAHEKAQERRNKSRAKKVKMTDTMAAIVEEKLKLSWSPVQISGWLKKQNDSSSISHESIYKYVWKDKHKRGCLYKNLRHSGKKYNKRSKGKSGRGCIPGRIDIDERPAIVEEKKRIGDWELDTIIGAGQSGAIVSMVDRASKLTKLVKVPQKTAEEVEEALISRLGPIKDFVLTLTADNGKEFSGHLKITERLEADFYFAKPYHSWQRGLNEHTNGLVRQYFPKCMAFKDISDDDLMRVEQLLNNRPRKVLEFRTPIEAFNELSRASPLVAFQG